MFLTSLLGTGVGVLLVACSPPAQSSPTAAPAAPAAPAEPPKPVAAPPASPAASPVAAPAASPAAALAPAYKPSPLSPAVTLNFGVLGSSSDSAIFIANDKGYFKDEGIELEYQRFNSLVDMVGPTVGGQLDIAAGGLAAGLFNAVARDTNLHVVADKGSAQTPQFEFSAMMIRKDLIDAGQVKDFKDLKGLNLVTSGKGVSPEVSLVKALEKGGLTLADVNYTNLSFPDMVTAFANKAIDGAIVIEPFVSRIVGEGHAVRWKGNLELYGGNQQIGVIVYSPKVYANQDLARRWLIGYVRGLRDYNDTFGGKKQGYDQVVEIMIKNTTVKDPKVYEQMKPAGLDPNGKLDVKSMQQDLDYYMKSGQVRTAVDLAKLIDTSFQEYAVRTLGPYTP